LNTEKHSPFSSSFIISEKRPAIIKRIQDARSQGDLSENADYDAAKEEQTNNEGRIAELEDLINNAQIIKISNSDKVSIGSKVTIENLSNKKSYTYEIVGAVDADPLNNKISNECPLAKALLSGQTGDIVDIASVSKPYSVKIVKIN
jgi:transcription elongation factor GreA